MATAGQPVMTGSMTEYLKGRTAIVTGAGQGMGRAVAAALARLGARVVVNDRERRTAEKVAAELRAQGAEAMAIVADVTNASGVRRMVARVLRRYSAIHILVNNAGVLRPTPTAEISEEEWDRVIAVNLKGTFLCSQAVLDSMRAAAWGRIVNFSSTAG